MALRVACGTTARGPIANVVAHHLWNRLERSNHRHGLALSLGLGCVGNRRIGDFGRAVRPRRSLPLGPRQHGSSSRVRSAARSPESLEGQPQEAKVVSCGATKTALWPCLATGRAAEKSAVHTQNLGEYMN